MLFLHTDDKSRGGQYVLQNLSRSLHYAVGVILESPIIINNNKCLQHHHQHHQHQR